MFDLNETIENWRRSLEDGGKLKREHVDELESHLRDELDQVSQIGPVTEEAFNKAVLRLGDLGKLSEEFSKVVRVGSGLTNIVEGEVLAMHPGKIFHRDRCIILLLFIGFCGIIGWVGTTCWMLQGWTNSRHWASPAIALRTIAGFSLSSSFFLVLTLIGVPWGLRLLRHSERRTKFIIRSLIPAVVLSPVYIFAGMIIILSYPWWAGLVKTAFVGPKIVQSQLSPDGKFEAYVVDKPSFDPPNHHLYIRRNDVNFSKEIAKLPGDVDFIQKIFWSPDSEIVVFQTWFSLIAADALGYRIVKIPLGGEEHWRKNGTFWVDYNGAKRIAAIEFPEHGTFSYRLEDSDKSKIIEMYSF